MCTALCIIMVNIVVLGGFFMKKLKILLYKIFFDEKYTKQIANIFEIPLELNETDVICQPEVFAFSAILKHPCLS